MTAASGTLFLTSKVRLHCDVSSMERSRPGSMAFPDLKGQAPLRLAAKADLQPFIALFLTSKVRLHCDLVDVFHGPHLAPLFLTSKVRLHCDNNESVLGSIVRLVFS